MQLITFLFTMVGKLILCLLTFASTTVIWGIAVCLFWLLSDHNSGHGGDNPFVHVKTVYKWWADKFKWINAISNWFAKMWRQAA